jgi:hypothetical protein
VIAGDHIEEPLHVFALLGVSYEGDAANFLGDVFGCLLTPADANDGCTRLRKGVCGLAADSLAGSQYNVNLVIEAE